METIVFNSKGEKVGKITLPETIFGVPWNADLVHQVVTSMQSNARHSTAHSKTRGEVRGGGKKPWKQKGTGRARHGSTRSPIWKGGGVTHGPRHEKIFKKKINQKARQKALLVTLSRKLKDKELIFLDSLQLQEPKTKMAGNILLALAREFPKLIKSHNAALIALPAAHQATQKSFKNFGHVSTIDIHNLNPISVLSSSYLIIVNPEAALEILLKKQVVKK